MGALEPFEPGELLARVQANRQRLDACPRHAFSSDVPGISQGVAAMFGRKMICQVCGGEMDLLGINQYIRGFEAAGGNGNEILPGWR